jgi:hypothetical protein
MLATLVQATPSDAASRHREQPAPPRERRHALRAALAILAACAIAWMSSARAEGDQFKLTEGELGLNVYGLSYHFQHDRAKELGFDNDVNPGLGARYRFGEWKRWSFFADAAVYRDSGRNTATTLGAGALWHIGGGFSAGGALAFFHSDTYNHGNPFIAPLPIATYDAGPVTLNLAFFPKISQYNDISTLGFWMTFWPKRW